MAQDNPAELRRRIDEAAAVLQAAPDVIGDNVSRNRAAKVAHANRVAWAILTTGRYPESVRYNTKEPADGQY